MFGSGAWVVGIALRWTSNGVQTLLATEGATLRANRALGAYEKRMAAVRDAQLRAGTFVAGTGFVALGATIAYATTQAAELQRTLIAIKNETGASGRAMEGFYKTAFNIGNIMGVSPKEASRVLLNISRLTAGQLSTAQMQAIAPQIAGFASTINFNRPDVSVEEATKAGLQLAHLFRAYTPQALAPMLDQVYRLSGLIAETPAQAVRQMSYYVPLFEGLKVDNNSAVAMMALLDRAGFRMKVGTNVRAMMMQAFGPLQITKHAQEGKLGMLEAMGVLDRSGRFAWNTPGGGVDYIGMLMQLAHWSHGEVLKGAPRSQIAKTIYGTFGMQGGNIAELMSDPRMVAFLQDIIRYQHNPNVSLAAGERNRQGSLIFQAQRLWGNFQAVLTELGYRAVGVTGAVKDLADGLHNVQQWLHEHRRAEDWFGGLAAGATALLGLRTAGGGLLMLFRALGVFKGMAGLNPLIAGLKFLDNFAFLGLGSKLVNLGKAIAGVDAAGAGTAAIGLTALAGSIASVTSVLGIIYGGIANMQWAAKSAANARLLNWSAGGANFGIMNPSAVNRSGADAFGVVHQTVNVNVNLPRGSDVGHATRIMSAINRAAQAANNYIVPGAYNSVPAHP